MLEIKAKNLIYTSVIPLQVPIVASTGGLVDTVEEGFTGFQMGSFSVDVIYSSPSYNSRVIPRIPLDSTVISVFIIDNFFQCEAVDPVDVAAVSTTVRRALATYGTQALAEMMKNGMAQDLSWKVSIGTVQEEDSLI